MSLLINAFVVRADKFRSSIEVFSALVSSELISPPNSLSDELWPSVESSLEATRVLPASAVY